MPNMTGQDTGGAPPARVLLVDDVPANLLSLEAILHDLGAVLVKAGSGEEALRRLLAEDYAVILMDVRMPGLDGYETARLIRGRDRCRHVPIIFVTAHESPEDVVVQAYKDGAADHLTKPLVPDALRAKVRSYLELAVRAPGGPAEAPRGADRHKDELLALLDTLQTNAPVGFAFVDRDCRYVRINPALAAMNGTPAAECLGRTVAEVVPLLWPRVGPLYRRVLRTGEAVTDQEVTGETAAQPGQVRHWLASYYPVRIHGAVAGVGVLITDITERKRLEEELRGHAAQLEEADRRKDEFLAMLSHELRNPLAPLRNGVHVLRLAGLAGPPAVGNTLEMMDRQLQHLTRLVDDLLDVARLTRGQVRLQKAPTDLAEAVARAVETARPLVEARRHELTVALPPGPLPLEADLPRIAQAFANLLNNAAKFTPPGGRLALTAAVEGGRAVVRVRDNGVGIRAEMLPRVFDLFAQADQSLDRSPGGLGVGLTLARSLVELHGGTVEAHSDGPGRGSEFVVRLPIADCGLRIADSADNPQSAIRNPQSRRVLVVDDNRDAAESLTMLLRAAGHEVQTAHSGPAALEAARAFRPEAVLLDIGLPGLDGYEVARRLRGEAGCGGALLVAVTGYGQDEDRRRAREAGFDHHLVKPADLATLQEILARAEPFLG